MYIIWPSHPLTLLPQHATQMSMYSTVQTLYFEALRIFLAGCHFSLGSSPNLFKQENVPMYSMKYKKTCFGLAETLVTAEIIKLCQTSSAFHLGWPLQPGGCYANCFSSLSDMLSSGS